MFEITDAKRENAPITAALIGQSGSGKTYSALLFARGLAGPDGKIVVIDSEGGRSKIYAGDPQIGNFRHLELVEPYTSRRFKEAFRAAEDDGADVIIIDTVSHEHEGFLEYADQEERRINGKHASRNKWIKPKADRKRFYSAISSSRAHCIVTIRMNRVVDMDAKPAKEIYKPECDKDLPYIMDLSVNIQPDHTTKYLKVPQPLIDLVQDGVMLSVQHGQILAQDAQKHAPQSETKSRVDDMLRNLESAAESGFDTLKTAYEAAWRNMGPAGDVKTMTPERAELQKHSERLKALAANAVEEEEADPSTLTQDDVADVDQEIEDKGLFNEGVST